MLVLILGEAMFLQAPRLAPYDSIFSLVGAVGFDHIWRAVAVGSVSGQALSYSCFQGRCWPGSDQAACQLFDSRLLASVLALWRTPYPIVQIGYLAGDRCWPAFTAAGMFQIRPATRTIIYRSGFHSVTSGLYSLAWGLLYG